MKKIQNILVGLDVSKKSIHVLQRAFLLANEKSARITIIHAIDSNFISELFSSYDELKNHALQTINEQLSSIDTKGIEYSIIVDKKSPSSLVVETAKEKNADLIIIGADEQDTDETAITSLTAHKIAQESKLPMLIVKNNCSSNSKYTKVVSFTDLSKVSLNSLNYAKDFFDLKSIKTVYAYKQMGEIALTYYNENKNKDRIQLGIKEKENKKFENFVKENNLLDTEIIESYSSTNNAIVEYVNANKSELVILGSKGLNNVSTFIFGSTTSFLIQNLKTDLLIYIPSN